MISALNAVVVALIVSEVSAYTLTAADFEGNITFFGFKDSYENRFVSFFNTSIADQGCDPEGVFTVIAHGWDESISTGWVADMVKSFLQYRGGCVFFMDYSRYADVSNYFALTPYFDDITAVLVKKMKQIGNYDQQLCFGFSFGSRLCIGAGKNITGTNVTNPQIGRMELCDPAGPGFNIREDPTPAAKNVACIDTSSDKGTTFYNCHQNFRMGDCGWSQAAAGPKPMGSHGLCPYLYTLAFNTSFVPNNGHYKCTSTRLMKNLTNDVRMGYTADFNRTFYRGDVFIATAKYPPYVVINNVIINTPPKV